MKRHRTESMVVRWSTVALSAASWVIGLAVTGEGRADPVPAGPVDFGRDIRPILNAKCTGCHGGVKKAGGVSFIQREKALGTGKSGEVVIVPGDPAASELVRRIGSEDPDERMPPPDEHPEGLEPGQIDLLKRWIAQGAEWSEHWAYRTPVAVPPPAVDDPAWSGPVDAFLFARMTAEGLEPSGAADRAQWLRRATFDLTGLPPTEDELESFVADESDDPHGKAVDRLLATPAFGERWAAMWLDLARYADSQGFEKDNHRDMWGWRDWVVRAFNDDMPFDAFTVRQLAGDLLPEATLDDVVATGFHRNTQTNTEGGTDDEEFRVTAVIDRVNTTWTVWQAVTFGCVQCHDHPYEPFRHDEYFAFYAAFNQTEDCDVGDDFPRVRVPADRERFAEARRLDEEIADVRRRLNDGGRERVEASEWIPLPVERVDAPESVSFSIEGGEVRVGGTVAHGTTYDVVVGAGGGGGEVPSRLEAVRLDILPTSDDPREWPEYGSVVSRFRAELRRPGGASREIAFREVIADALVGPFDPEESLRDGQGGGGSFPRLDGPVWLTFVPEEAIVPAEGETLHLLILQDIRNAETKGAVVRRFRVSATSDRAWAGFREDAGRATQAARLAELREARQAIPDATTVPVLAERDRAAARETRVFIRGNALDKGDVVAPSTPSVLPPSDLSENPRLGVARWIADERNPLTARVLVNRVWAQLFGTGIVETVGDFGSTGTAPTHPELLDSLAVRFMRDHQWHLKPLLRELVLTAAYRQDHAATPASLARDPGNRLLARGPRTRLAAEMVRDQALAVSGLLEERRFGPPVMPPQPDGVWSVVYSGAQWKTAEGPDRYRRGLYTYWRRTSPYPSFMTFDAPSREVCSARRIPTNTPLQALVTLNDPVFIEAAQALARRIREAHGSDDVEAALVAGHRLVTQQDPPPVVLASLERLYGDALAEYRAAPELLEGFAASADEAAFVLVANALLNLDTALTK